MACVCSFSSVKLLSVSLFYGAYFAGEFPTLQNKMRAVLRVEVEAVRFLKEEPHKLDILLKRVRNMTDTLTTLRR